MSDTMRDALKRWAAEQGFETWAADHAAVLRNLAAWLDREALAARPETSEGASRFPREPKQAGGWTIQYNFLNDMKAQIEKRQSEDVPNLEEIEAVLLAVEAQAAPAPEQGERALREADEDIDAMTIRVANEIADYCIPTNGGRMTIQAGGMAALKRALLSRQSAEEPDGA